jgi:hypothetical protein
MKSKRLVVAALFFAFLVPAGWAQKGHELLIGADVSLTSVWIMNQNFYGEPECNYAPKMGYGASFNLGYHVTENIGFRVELQYSVQGQKYEDKQVIDEVKYDTKRDITLEYINVPLLFKYAFGKSTTKFRILAGPQLGYLLSATQTYKRDGKTLGTTAVNLDGETFQTDAKDITDRFIQYDIGMAVDLGADIPLSYKIFFSPGFRMNYGFKDINAEAYRMDDRDGEYSPSHNFWAGFYFGLIYKIDVESYSQRSF